jgi:RimJ/RimL family protein N-acetyltransferase
MILTERLKVIPLKLDQFKLLLEGTDKMEEALGLNASNEQLDEHTQQAMDGLYQLAVKHKENYVWYTNWQIILKSDNISIGSACFMGYPNEKGEIEIEYGINKNYQNKGYMTEALQAICRWALSQSNVTSVIAESEKHNKPSHRVLQKSHFQKIKETDNSYFWHITK